MEFDTIQAVRSAADLDSLADRLEASLRLNGWALTVKPAGNDEVSVRAAQTLGDVADSFAQATEAGIKHLRQLADGLRSVAGAVVQMDSNNAAEFRLVV
ncbi:PE family protein [Nocardia sp. CDC160]|uniref:PE family protein n=1 Tax=Nocardia sp. CDC160 TaxID=3112166 RepID=UPI002DBFED06|nr:PE family protein [Nocardia sp. CDC160]MEC3919253.1 PE family protein [Nocardia sp. CDC160]